MKIAPKNAKVPTVQIWPVSATPLTSQKSRKEMISSVAGNSQGIKPLEKKSKSPGEKSPNSTFIAQKLLFLPLFQEVKIDLFA